MKKFKAGLLIVGLILLAWGGKWLYSKAGQTGDFREAIFGSGGIELVNYSFDRRMVNRIVISPETEIWVPRGYGWYQSGKVAQLLKDEKKEYLWPEVLFYNLGYDAEWWQEGEPGNESDDDGMMISHWGWWPWLQYKLNEGNWLPREETIDNLGEAQTVDEMMLRDMADAAVTNEDTRVMIYNATGNDGLAAFMGRILGRAGVTVTGWENSDPIGKVCVIRSGKDWQKYKSAVMIKKQLPECEVEVDPEVPDNEAEIYFGESFATMINYNSFNSYQN